VARRKRFRNAIRDEPTRHLESGDAEFESLVARDRNAGKMETRESGRRVFESKRFWLEQK